MAKKKRKKRKVKTTTTTKTTTVVRTTFGAAGDVHLHLAASERDVAMREARYAEAEAVDGNCALAMAHYRQAAAAHGGMYAHVISMPKDARAAYDADYERAGRAISRAGRLLEGCLRHGRTRNG